jgi:hypothetical protein
VVERIFEGDTTGEMVEVFIKVSGYADDSDDKWINPIHIVEIHYNSREQRYDIAMSSERYIQVLERQAMEAIDKLVGRGLPGTPDTDETYI